MQDIAIYANASSTLGTVRDFANTRNMYPPSFTRASQVKLHIRLFVEDDDMSPYPIEQLERIVSWQCIFDRDYNQSTTPLIIADNSEISASAVTVEIGGISYDYSEITVPISGMNSQELINAIGNNEQLNGLNMELVGFDGTADTVFILQLTGFSVRNRIFYTGTPTDVPETYLNAEQVRALIALGVVTQFSSDGTSWHNSQQGEDTYLRYRSASSASSPWAILRIPAAESSSGDASNAKHYATMPDASSVSLGTVAIYDGETSASYTKGHIYKAISGSASTPSLTARPYVMTFEQLVSSPASFADTGEVCNGHPVYKIENWAKTHDDSTFIHVWLWNSKAQDDNIDYWVVYAGGVSQVAETFTKSGKDGWCTTIDGTYTALGIGIIDSDSGLVVTAGSSAEPSWHDITPSGSGGSASWGGITGTLSSQTDLAEALAAKADLVTGKVPSEQLPGMSSSQKGIARINQVYGINIGNDNLLIISKASNNAVDAHSDNYKPIVPNNLPRAVRSVLPNITTIPSDSATPYALTDASATTNNHCYHYQHAPDSAPTYQLPAVTDTTITHDIVIFLDLSSVATFSFQDSSGTTVAVDTNGVTPAIGEKWTVWAEYVHNTWIVRGMRDMEASA